MQYDLELLSKENEHSILRKEVLEIEGIEIRNINFKNNSILLIQVSEKDKIHTAFREILTPGLADQPDLFRKDLESLYSKEIQADNFEDTPEKHKQWWGLPDKTGIPVEAETYCIPPHIKKIGDKVYAPMGVPDRIVIPHGIDYNESCILHMVEPKFIDEELTKLEEWDGSTYYSSIQTCSKGSKFKIGIDMDLNAFEVKYGAVEHYIFRKT